MSDTSRRVAQRPENNEQHRSFGKSRKTGKPQGGSPEPTDRYEPHHIDSPDSLRRANRNRYLKDEEVPMHRGSFSRRHLSVMLTAAVAALVALAAMLVANPAQAASTGALRGYCFRPVSRRVERQPDRRCGPADLGLLGRDQPAVDVDGQQPADRVRQQMPGRSEPRHHGRYPGADLDLQRRCQPAVAGELRRHDRRRGVRAVPGRLRAPVRPTARRWSSGRATAAATRSGPACPGSTRRTGGTCSLPSTYRWTSTGALAQPANGLGLAEGLHQRRLQRQAPGLRVERVGIVVRLDGVQSLHELVGHGVGRPDRNEPGHGGAHAVLLRAQEHLGAGVPVGCVALHLPHVERPHQPQRLVLAAAAVHRQHLRLRHRPDRPDPDRRRPEHVPVLRR